MKNKFEETKVELKKIFFGIDEQIDQVIKTFETWESVKDYQIRPMTVCLWGLTGTGKTALFEAIELALTGTVARLMPNRESLNKENMLALIRDKENEAKVSLLFNGSEYSAVVGANGEVRWTAPDWFYGDSNQ